MQIFGNAWKVAPLGGSNTTQKMKLLFKQEKKKGDSPQKIYPQNLSEFPPTFWNLFCLKYQESNLN